MRTSLLAVAAVFAAADLAAAVPAAANGCFAATYATCSNSRPTGATSCIDGYYLAGGRCKPLAEGQYKGADGKPVSCPANVKVCTATAITSCKSGFFLTTDKTACVSSCPDSFYGNKATGGCAACHSLAIKACSNARVSGATSCMPGYGLTGGRCMPAHKVPEGSYLSDNGQVRKCAVNQKSCNELGALSCESPYFLTPDADCSLDCPLSMFGNAKGVCQSCFSPNFATCSSARSSAATSCISGFYLASGRCMPAASVPAGKYGGSDGKLHSCPDRASTCTAAGPTSCATGYTLSADKTKCEAKPSCPPHAVCDSSNKVVSCTDSYLLYNGQCIDHCPTGVFYHAQKAACFDECPARTWHYDMSTCYEPRCPQQWIDNEFTCTDCGLNVQTCDQTRAVSCSGGDQWVPFPNSEGRSINCAFTGCPEGQYTPEWNDVCVPCPMENVELCRPISGELIRCKDGYASSGNNCVAGDSCPRGEYPVDTQSSGKVCSQCPYIWNGAASCNQDGMATECAEGFTLQSDPNPDGGNLCVATPSCPEFAVCSGADGTTPTSCTDGRVFYRDQCFPGQCPEGTFINAARDECYDVCPDGEYPRGNECVTCRAGPNVARCDQTTSKTLQCKEGFALSGPIEADYEFECVPLDGCAWGARPISGPNGLICAACPDTNNNAIDDFGRPNFSGKVFRCDEEGNATSCNTDYHVESDPDGGLDKCVADTLP